MPEAGTPALLPAAPLLPLLAAAVLPRAFCTRRRAPLAPPCCRPPTPLRSWNGCSNQDIAISLNGEQQVVQYIVCPIGVHEGDWERISLLVCAEDLSLQQVGSRPASSRAGGGWQGRARGLCELSHAGVWGLRLQGLGHGRGQHDCDAERKAVRDPACALCTDAGTRMTCSAQCCAVFSYCCQCTRQSRLCVRPQPGLLAPGPSAHPGRLLSAWLVGDARLHCGGAVPPRAE